MSDDLVERLRNNAKWGIPDFTNSKLLDEAAAEIERLRAFIATLRNLVSEATDIIETVEKQRHPSWDGTVTPTSWLGRAGGALADAPGEEA